MQNLVTLHVYDDGRLMMHVKINVNKYDKWKKMEINENIIKCMCLLYFMPVE